MSSLCATDNGGSRKMRFMSKNYVLRLRTAALGNQINTDKSL